MEEERERLQLDWVKVFGAALAAMSSAVLLSTLGAAGTIIGAALGSIVITAGGSVYSHYLDLSRQRVARAQAAASRRISDARTQLRRTATELDDSAEPADAAGPLAKAEHELRGAASGLREVEQTSRPTYRETLKGLPWKRIALAAAGVFLVVMAVITVFELVTGRAVSSYTGGSDKDARTSITGLVRGGAEDPPTDEPQSPAEDSTQAPTGGTEGPTPRGSVGDGATDGPTDEPTDEVPTPTSEPTPEPTPEPTADPEPSAPAPTAPAS